MTVLHPAVRERLDRLAPDQRAAATAPPGPVLCVAPAGSGKTTTLVARICWLVANGADPTTITAVTFNKRAADELSERLSTALEALAVDEKPRVRTFHALGREILAEAGAPVGNLVDRADTMRRLNGGRRLPGASMRRLDDAFSRLKLDQRVSRRQAELLLAQAEVGDGQPQSDILRAYIAYESHLEEQRSLDFDDLVRGALDALTERADLLSAWRSRCTTLLVDEVQDVDRSQLELAVLLAGERRDIFLVGDDDQTIYAWRLADVRRVLDLAGSLPGLRRIDLTTNYRCPRPVIARAVRLIEVNAERFAKRIEAGPAADGELMLGPDPADELARARRLLTRWMPLAEGRHAILARTNAELAPFAAVALELGIPYHAADDGLLLDDPAVDEVLTLLDAADPRTPPAVTLARQKHHQPVSRSMVAWALRMPDAGALHVAIEDARRRRAELRRDDADLVLATAHGTKGLEFDHVACIGLDEGTFPSRRTLADAQDPARALEEERRLAYVAWTRARRSLLLVYDPNAPSIFMREAFSGEELGLAS